MSWSSMAAELAGNTPVPFPYCLTLVNRAWNDAQAEYDWGFKWLDFSIPTPSPTGTGTVTLTRGLTTVIGDTAASAAWAAIGLVNPITTQQLRIGQGTIYNIIAYDTTSNSPFGTLTLDRAYVDAPSGPSQGYQILGVYYHAPVKNFIWFDSIRDPITGYNLKTTTSRQEADDSDPQRLQFTFPDAVIPYKVDLNPGAFFGFPMYEFWPATTAGITYVGQAFLGEKDFDNTVPGSSDVVLPPIREDAVMAKASEKAYEWCAANLDKLQPEQRRGDFNFLMGKAKDEFKRLINQAILKDESFANRHHIPYAEMREYLPTLPWAGMRANVAVFPS